MKQAVLGIRSDGTPAGAKGPAELSALLARDEVKAFLESLTPEEFEAIRTVEETWANGPNAKGKLLVMQGKLSDANHITSGHIIRAAKNRSGMSWGAFGAYVLAARDVFWPRQEA